MNTKFCLLVSMSCLFLMGQKSVGIDLVFESIEVTVNELKEEVTIGASMNRPIVFEKEKKYHAFKIMQDDYIRKNYEDYKIIGDSLIINSLGRIIQGFTLESINDSQEIEYIYFDVDDVCRKYKRLDDKKMAQRVQYLLKTGATGKMKKVKIR